MFKNRSKVVDIIKNLPIEAGMPTINGLQGAVSIYQALGSVYDKIGETEKSQAAFKEAADGLETLAELLTSPLRELEDGPPLIVTAPPIPHHRRRK